ncbi:hypothetical protein DPEC_G00117180 [Dallia pectoralis]|uniref:Uncharacterized protein n=1 Tax=Dallia pectoralis TaxID=75939 RepID=A0ACC2GV10_DALPE|nr:hypothetical protein DPEC_G00117180 [Dallia pectoralis]
MELLGAFYRRKLRRKPKKGDEGPGRGAGALGRSDGALCKSPSEANVNNLATGLISKVLRFTRRSGSISRPHSWHSTKLSEGQTDPSMMQISPGTTSPSWHQTYHSSASTTDLLGYDPGYLRKSPDQYSSRGSMESLGEHQGQSAYSSSCQQLSASKSSNSIDHLHSKRDSAYSSFSTSSSIPEYLAATPTFNKEKSYSMEMVPQRGGVNGGGGGAGAEDLNQADIRYVHTGYDPQQGGAQEHEVSSAALLRNHEGGRVGSRSGGGASCQRGSSSSSSSSGGDGGSNNNNNPNRHSVGPIWGQGAGRSSNESLKGAPAPPTRSDSYAAIRNHERPNSWSSLEQARSLRALQKGSWHHSSGPVAPGPGKGSYGAEGQLHTVIEKSPESSPTIKPKQGQVFPLPPQTQQTSNLQSGLLVLPQGIYPVPPSEPHHPKMPTACPDTVVVAVENGFQSNSQPHHLPQQLDSTHPPHRQPTYPDRLVDTGEDEAEPEETRTQPGHYCPHWKGDGQAAYQRQSQQVEQATRTPLFVGQERRDPYTPVQSRGERLSRCPQGSEYPPESQGREVVQVTELSHSQLHSQTAGSRAAKMFRSTNLDLGPEPQVEQRAQRPDLPSNDQRSKTPVQQYSDPSPPQQQKEKKGREHPLTRLENALAEVQRCPSPEGSTSSKNSYQRSLSVLEKVSHFEQSQGKQRSLSISANLGSRPSQPPFLNDLRNMLERCNSPSYGHRALSSSSSSSHETTTVARESHPYEEQLQRGKCEQAKLQSFRYPQNQRPEPQDPHPALALQRSRSTLHLGHQGDQEENGYDGAREKGVNLKDDLQDLLGTIQYQSFNRTYRDSIKDAQSKVLRSTSFRRKDLGARVHPASGVSNNPPTVPTKHLSLERKTVAPRTSPKPLVVANTVPGLSTSTNPHTPKERHTITTPDPAPATAHTPHTPKQRHVVTPEPAGVSTMGPPVPVRIGGRKRLTAAQKKRSYSEPESMHEVGLELDPRRSAQQQFVFPGTETSVADRRRMFEMAASRSLSSSSQPYQSYQNPQASPSASRPELRQLQQDALADYMERKRGWKTDRGEGQQHFDRPHSAYLQSFADTRSISSTSLASLQEPPGLDSSLFGGGRLSSTLPPGLQGFYPGRVSAPPVSACNFCPDPAESGSDRLTEGDLPVSGLGRKEPVKAYEAMRSQGFSQRAFDRASPTRSSGKSVSAEDLLERLDERPPPQHFRSRSSPSERPIQDFMAGGDLRLFEISTEPRICTRNNNKSLLDTQASERPMSASQCQSHCRQSQGLSKSNTSVMRRDRQRNPDRQRALSASGLAASVGLPCPFSPPGTSPRTSLGWEASEQLSQANMDAISFPNLMHSNAPKAETPENQPPQATRGNPAATYQNQTRRSWTRQDSSDTSEDTLTDFPLERDGSSPEAQVTAPKTTPPPVLPKTSPPPTKSSPPSPKASSSAPAPRPHPLISLRISESNLLEPPSLLATTHTVTLEDYDEVFLQEPPPPPPPTPPIRETDITEDFPPPPLPLLPPSSSPSREQKLEQRENRPTRPKPFILRTSYDALEAVVPDRPSIPSASTQAVSSAQLLASQRPSLTSEPRPESPALQTCVSPSNSLPEPQQGPSEEESLGPEYHLLARRERSTGELRVEALVKQLVSRGEKNLNLLLDSWVGSGRTSAMDLMEEIYPAGGGRLLWQRRRSSTWLENRRPDGGCSTGQREEGGGTETNLDEEDADLHQKRMELLQALTLSVASLRGERENLAEEQRRFRDLGGQMETLVQEHCKPNEKEKFRMFIGDLDKIVNLLLSLCYRLARVDNALLVLDTEEDTQEGTEERESLQQKRRQLCSQHEDARELKEYLDRRERMVLDILGGYLTGPQLRDYQLYVRVKPALLIRQRHLDELIKQADDCLKEGLPSGESDHQGPPGDPQVSTPGPGSTNNPSILVPNPHPGASQTARSTTVTSL